MRHLVSKTTLPGLALFLCTSLACGGGGEPAADSAPAPSAEAASPDEDAEADATDPYADREATIRRDLVALAEGEFPDDTGLDWNIIGLEHNEHLTYVEVQPEPSTVGYERFQFVMDFRNAESPELIATYALIEGTFKLLSTVPELQDDLPESRPRMH